MGSTADARAAAADRLLIRLNPDAGPAPDASPGPGASPCPDASPGPSPCPDASPEPSPCPDASLAPFVGTRGDPENTPNEPRGVAATGVNPPLPEPPLGPTPTPRDTISSRCRVASGNAKRNTSSVVVGGGDEKAPAVPLVGWGWCRVDFGMPPPVR